MANCILSFANLRTSIFTSSIFVVAPLFAAEQPCDSQPFSGDGQLILLAARQLQNPEDTDAEVFLDETTIKYDDEGRRTIQTCHVYSILT